MVKAIYKTHDDDKIQQWSKILNEYDNQKAFEFMCYLEQDENEWTNQKISSQLRQLLQQLCS